MTRAPKSLGVVLLGMALASPAGTNDLGHRIQHGKGDFATIGSAPQVLTAAEVEKMSALRTPASGPVGTSRNDAGPLPPKPAELPAVGPTPISITPVDLTKPSRVPRFDVIDLSRRPTRPKPPEISTREPAAMGLTAAEIAKVEALRRMGASSKQSRRSER